LILHLSKTSISTSLRTVLRACLYCIGMLIAYMPASAQTCACTNCPLALPDNFSGDAFLAVSGAANPTLGVNGQGVCGVNIEISHEYVGDLEIYLISPSGQSVQLFGNVGFWGNTDFTTWDIGFLPCGVMPMPDAGFDPQWDNNQVWGMFGNYDGTYHPYNGCLENFNTGPVNGTWTLHIEDEIVNDIGVLVNWSLIFCDMTGVDCVTCAAQAGNLLQSDITGCAGSAGLQLTLPPSYPAGVVVPPAASYSYDYIVATNGGAILSISPTPNLTALPTGNYTVCGLSYLTTQAGAIPAAVGQTINQLNAAISNINPPFCGDISNNCVNVTIQPPRTDSTLLKTICAGSSFSFFGTTYTTSGIYTQQVSLNNCDFSATLDLRVLSPTQMPISEVICNGGCATTAGFGTACTTGTFTDTIVGFTGCDSIIKVLDLTVLDVQNIQFSPPTAALACGASAMVTVTNTGNQPGSTLTYVWHQGASNAVYQSGSQLTTMTPGTYEALICEQLSGTTCCDSASMTITTAQSIPPPPTQIIVPTPICTGDTITVITSAMIGANTYYWQIPAGLTVLAGTPDTVRRLIANGPITGQICLALANSCGISDTFCVPISVAPLPPAPNVSGVIAGCPGVQYTYLTTNRPLGVPSFWTYSGQASVVTFTDSLHLTWPANLSNGQVCAHYISACNDTLRTCVAVATGPAIPPLTQILSNIDSVCFGGSVDVYIPLLAAPGIGYDWSFPPSMSISAGAGTDRIRVVTSAVGNYSVCGWYTTACGNSDTICRPIIVLNNQPPDAGQDLFICDTTVVLQGTGTSGIWSVITSPAPGSGTFTNATASNSVFHGAPGNYQLMRTSGGGACTRRDTMLLRLALPLQSSIIGTVCSANNQTYSVIVQYSGGTAPYIFNGQPASIGIDTIGTFASGTTGQVIISDAQGCADTVSLNYTCGCSNSAGTMLPNPMRVCGTGTISLPYNNDATTGVGQTVIFAVGATNIWTGAPIAWYPTPNVAWSAALYTANASYYAYAVVVNLLPNGQPNLTDACLQASQPVEIQWLSAPDMQITAAQSTCLHPDSSLVLTFTPSVGALPLTATLYNAAGVVQVFNVSVSGVFAFTDPNPIAGWYRLAGVTLDNLPTCIDLTPDSILVSIGSAPILAGPDITSTCDTVVTLQGSGAGGVWSLFTPSTNAVIGNPNIPNSTFSASPGSYTLVRSNLNAVCLQQDLMQVTLGNPLQITSAVANCLPGDSTFVITVNWTGGTGPYLITGGPPGSITGTTAVATLYTSGSLGRAILQDAVGCFDTVFASINCSCANNPGSFSAFTAEACAGSPILLPYLNNQVLLPGQVLNFVVADPVTGNYIVTQASPNIAWSAGSFMPGVQYFGFAVISTLLPNGSINFADTCLQTSPPIDLRWLQAPSAILSGDQATCFGVPDTLSFTITPTSTVFPLTGSLVNGLGVVQSFTLNGPGPITITDTQPSDGWHWINGLVMSQSPGCQAIVSDSLFVANVLMLQAIVADSVGTCNAAANSTINFDNLVFTGIVGGGWSGGVGTGPYSNRDFTGVAPGLYPFVYQSIPNPPCPSGNDTTWVRVGDCSCPPFTLQPNAGTFCNQSAQPINLTAFQIAAPPGVWSVQGTNLPLPTITGTQLNPLGAALGPIDLIFTLTAPQAGCPVSATIAAQIVYGGLSAGTPLQDTVSYCAGLDTMITLTNLIQNAANGGQWRYRGGSSTTYTTATEQSGTLAVATYPTGLYLFSYIHAAAPPCLGDTSSFWVRILNAPTANAGSDQLIDCSLTSVVLEGGASSQGPQFIYNWINSQTSLSLSTDLQYTASAEGVYIFVVTDIVSGCMSADTMEVLSDGSVPSAQLIVTAPGCNNPLGGTISIVQINGGTPPYQIMLNGQDYGTQTLITGLTEGNYMLQITDQSGCTWTEPAVLVPAAPEVIVSLGQDQSIYLGDSTRVDAQISSVGTIDTMIWSVLGIDTLPMSLEQTYQPTNSIRIRLTVIDTSGCSGTDDVLIDVIHLPSITVPNVMALQSTQNQLITVLGDADVEQIDLWQIYDRWGNRVHEAAEFAPGDYAYAWDGSFRGKPVQPGVFVYTVRYTRRDGKVFYVRGDITVVR
jgi:Proprotein convertase P-domain/PKD-like domain